MSSAAKMLPAGSTDCHVHIYGPFAEHPPLTEGRFAPAQEFPVESLFRMWDAIGVSRGVIVHALTAGQDNEVTLQALKRFPERLRAVAVLSDHVTDKRLDELTAAGFRGARVNMLRQDGKPVSAGGLTFEGLKKLAPRIADRGWHAQLWIETGDLDAMSKEIEALPLDFVLDHMGRTMTDKTVNYTGFQTFLDRLKTGRYWCKISGADRNTRQGAPYADTEAFIEALVAANSDRLVWGTDWPHVGHAAETLPNENVLIHLLLKSIPNETTRQKILVDNAAKLYGF